MQKKTTCKTLFLGCFFFLSMINSVSYHYNQHKIFFLCILYNLELDMSITSHVVSNRNGNKFKKVLRLNQIFLEILVEGKC